MTPNTSSIIYSSSCYGELSMF